MTTNPGREATKDCDFFVGVNNFTTTNTQQAIEATVAALGEVKTNGRG